MQWSGKTNISRFITGQADNAMREINALLELSMIQKPIVRNS